MATYAHPHAIDAPTAWGGPYLARPVENRILAGLRETTPLLPVGNCLAEMADPDSPSVAKTSAEHSESHVNVKAPAGAQRLPADRSETGAH